MTQDNDTYVLIHDDGDPNIHWRFASLSDMFENIAVAMGGKTMSDAFSERGMVAKPPMSQSLATMVFKMKAPLTDIQKRDFERAGAQVQNGAPEGYRVIKRLFREQPTEQI